MSIIEKAVGRLDQSKGAAGAVTPAAESAIEIKAETAAEHAPAVPVASALVEAVIPTPAPAAAPAPLASAEPVAAVQATQRTTQQEQAQTSARKSTSRRIEIDLAQLHQLGMVTPDAERTIIAEEFRLIKRPLIEKAFAKNNTGIKHHGNLIMVASSLPGEGKTFCAVNLAISIAMEMDHTVLLVDADVARPSVPRYLRLDPADTASAVGLMDVLLDDKLDLADAMLKTNIDTLSILPAGRSHKRATELLASQAMSSLLDEIANRYPDRIVIFDSPPLLLTTEARVLANQMGQIVLVVEAEATTQHVVKEVLRQLKSHTNVNLVYNKAKTFAGGDYYGRYYG
ncbi:XrtA-associated tyrosine autokinase [Undibacterium sp. TJN25]|uniref:XrtA-associated tyrosine autokinase n=1 Tax=Undibacterium sp. TJN25 TaxID=3413056 RepID=UPI003BF353CF